VPQVVAPALSRGGLRGAAATDKEPVPDEHRFAEIEFEELSRIIIKKRACYQVNKQKVYGLWRLCNLALIRACETHRDYPNILRNRDLLLLWRLVTTLCTVGLRDNANLEKQLNKGLQQ
jgi:hypothetical protein